MPDQPASTLMRRLLPQAHAWRAALTTTLRKLFDGASESHQAAREFVDDVYDDLSPTRTRELAEFERQFGLPGSGTEASRRAQLGAAWSASGGQAARYIQDVLRAAGFDVYVHECWASPGVARDPRLYTQVPTFGTTQCGDPLAECGEPTATCNAFLANDPHYIVNDRLTLDPPPYVPSDPNTWPFFLYVGGATFGTTASLSVAVRSAFEELLLRIRPTHLWLVEIIDWVEVIYVLVDGDRVLVDGDYVAVTP